MKKKILLIVGGGIKHALPFTEEARKLGVDLTVAPFSSLEYELSDTKFSMTAGGKDVSTFAVCYIRMVGKRLEEAALFANYCTEKKIRLVDRMFQNPSTVRLPLPKSIETKILGEKGVSTPKTYFGSLKSILEKAPIVFQYPFVIKSTTGKQGHGVWAPRNKKELEELFGELKQYQKKKKGAFIAQEFIQSSQRTRVFVIGERAVAAITRPTRWRRRFIPKINGKFPEGKRGALYPIPKDQAAIAVKAAKALGIEIAGVDILINDKTKKLFVLEVNSAPRWESIKGDTGMNVEREILKYLMQLS